MHSRMTVLIAPDKFKGTLTAAEVGAAIAAGLREAGIGHHLCPLADGGDGTADVLLGAIGGSWIECPSEDALGRPIEARWAKLDDERGSAVVEVAEASGLARIAGEPLRPLQASSAGTGVLIAAALEAGCERVLLACGGSATTDAGLGALEHFDPAAAEIVCLCDTGVPFMGALRYAPQKGAGQAELSQLEDRLERIAAELPNDPRKLPWTGAAGGLSGGLWAHGARLVSGSQFVLDAVGFGESLTNASACITGEGRLDATSFTGKAVGEVSLRCLRAGVECHAIVGGVERGDARLDRFASITEVGDRSSIAAAAGAALSP